MENAGRDSVEATKRSKAVKRTVIILALIAFAIYVVSVYKTLTGD
jgi:hypothetical protein